MCIQIFDAFDQISVSPTIKNTVRMNSIICLMQDGRVLASYGAEDRRNHTRNAHLYAWTLRAWLSAPFARPKLAAALCKVMRLG